MRLVDDDEVRSGDLIQAPAESLDRGDHGRLFGHGFTGLDEPVRHRDLGQRAADLVEDLPAVRDDDNTGAPLKDLGGDVAEEHGLAGTGGAYGEGPARSRCEG